ncbi:MAG TPA: hypothetical protein VKU00_18390 [Chthonomonadaceae bacterium]|nr:hypothetical protein [Chthonomonadaceae bacterium]
MLPIPSNPTAFTVGSGPFPEEPSQTCTFAIPAGYWVSATWGVTATWSVPSSSHAVITTGVSDTAATPSHLSGTFTDTVAASVAQMADINAAVGGNLTASFGGPQPAPIPPTAGEIAVSAFTLTLVGCTYSLSPNEASYDCHPHNGTFQVLTISSCGWTAASDNPDWLHVVGGASGSGNGTVDYTVDENVYPGAARMGAISIGDQVFTVAQGQSIDPFSGTGATVTLVTGDAIPHPHTHAAEQFIQVLYPHGYQPGVETNVGNLQQVLWSFARPRADLVCLWTGTQLRLYDLAGNELIPGSPVAGVDIWRWGY